MYLYHTLPNGLRIVFRRTDSPVAYSGVYIGVGSRHEQGPEEGVAHFIEHSIFKGTTHRRAYHILNRIDGVGGELNAFTTKEETCIYASSLVEHLPRCIELFSDVLFNSQFPLHEIENEKDVVIEEINSYRDQPADLIYDEFEEYFFEGHPLAHNILGTKKNVKAFTPEFLRDFLVRNYTPDRMVLTVVANIDFEKLIRLADRHFCDKGSLLDNSKLPQQSSDHLKLKTSSLKLRKTYPPINIFHKTLNRHTHQTHMLLGCLAPDLFDERKVAFSLLNNLIGGPAMNSRLNVAVREKYGFCYTIESQYVPFTDTGLFYIYAGVDHGAADRARDLIFRELHRLATEPLTPNQLRAAQRQYIGQMAINNDSSLNEMQSIGKAYLNYDRVDTIDEMARDILALTPDDLLAAASRLTPDNFSQLIYK
ncbi:MAG: insulinase family protein [Bacteroidales bacterium]|nr:insulinase family protein [Bacteroidales bacterium]